jgi:hypothetical protein
LKFFHTALSLGFVMQASQTSGTEQTTESRPHSLDVLDLQMCAVRVRCSSCGMALFASAPKATALAFAGLGMPPLLAIEPTNRETISTQTENMKVCPNCKEHSLYDDGIVSQTIDVVEMYNLRVSGSVPTLCIDCRASMCDFSANFLASIHISPQSSIDIEIDLSGIDSTDMRKLALCRGSLIMITDGGDDRVVSWALHVSRMLRKRFDNLRPSRYLSGGIAAFKRVFPGLFTPPVTISLPACVLSLDGSGTLRSGSPQVLSNLPAVLFLLFHSQLSLQSTFETPHAVPPTRNNAAHLAAPAQLRGARARPRPCLQHICFILPR